jgi:hypothetical protein
VAVAVWVTVPSQIDSNNMSKEAEEWLTDYLQATTPKDWPRVLCCESSRSLYCPECCRILIPREDWPGPIEDGSLRSPFDIDIILDEKERRTCATGLHMLAINSEIAAISQSTTRTPLTERQDPPNRVQIFDLGREEMPCYDQDQDGVYVLFPSKDSVPISSVGPIKKLIVLDCKWSRPSMKSHPNILSLPRVHLVDPPAESHYWRWHNSGDGMLSTMEAIYFSMIQVTEDWPLEKRKQLIHIMWLFALQRSVISKRSEMEQRPIPFTEAGKDCQRELRMLQNGNPRKKKVSTRS